MRKRRCYRCGEESEGERCRTCDHEQGFPEMDMRFLDYARLVGLGMPVLARHVGTWLRGVFRLPPRGPEHGGVGTRQGARKGGSAWTAPELTQRSSPC